MCQPQRATALRRKATTPAAGRSIRCQRGLSKKRLDCRPGSARKALGSSIVGTNRAQLAKAGRNLAEAPPESS